MLYAPSGERLIGHGFTLASRGLRRNDWLCSILVESARAVQWKRCAFDLASGVECQRGGVQVRRRSSSKKLNITVTWFSLCAGTVVGAGTRAMIRSPSGARLIVRQHAGVGETDRRPEREAVRATNESPSCCTRTPLSAAHRCEEQIVTVTRPTRNAPATDRYLHLAAVIRKASHIHF